jgi:hypothetical protein
MTSGSQKLVPNSEELLRFLKSRTHAYHLSNLFFRDFHYAILAYVESKGKKTSYGRAEELALQVISDLEQSGILKSIKPGSWMLNYPEFRKESVKPAPAAKPGPVATAPKAVTPSIASEASPLKTDAPVAA